jgi:hypothetical protein
MPTVPSLAVGTGSVVNRDRRHSKKITGKQKLNPSPVFSCQFLCQWQIGAIRHHDVDLFCDINHQNTDTYFQPLKIDGKGATFMLENVELCQNYT